MNKRLFIVSNRLPVNVEKDNGKLHVQSSSGGLVSAINSFLQQPAAKTFTNVYWAGVPCCDAAEWQQVSQLLPPANHEYIPVYVNNNLYNEYYNGFSNSTLWPLYHYFPSLAEYNNQSYKSYQQVNKLFAESLQRHLHPQDTVWIQDYHLLPLAAMIRQSFPEITIGFFLHIPFPSYEIFRLIPRQWQHDILKGMLGADLIGFHTIDYTAHFIKCVQMVLGYENDMHTVKYDNRLIKADVFPISIDYEKFNQAYDNNQVAALRRDLKEKFPGKKIIFSVDRLDYTKGVSHRLEGYRCFLEKNPQYKEKLVFVLVIVPSREFITKYSERKRLIDEMISNINSKIGTLHWQPVIYQYTSLSFEQMLALYTGCDIALITPLRDGMNLVAKEFVASRKDKKGVLLLSEMAGAARELTTALHLNPNDVEEIAEKIKEGLEMHEPEQQERMEAMQQRISYYNISVWASDFIKQLAAVKARQSEFQIKFIDEQEKRYILAKYQDAPRRLFLLDYDGTLVTYSNQPSLARPGEYLMQVLAKLTKDERNKVYLISGRNSDLLDQWFQQIPIGLVAEHGAKIKHINCQWQTLVNTRVDWKPEVRRIMEEYVKRCSNSFIEEKEYCMVWHFRNCNAQQSAIRSLELLAELNEFINHLGIHVVIGNKIVEVKAEGADKGSVVKNELLNDHYNFIFAAGDDKTDEDMFRLIYKMDQAYSIKVGPDASYARYNLMTPAMVVSLLDAFSQINPNKRYLSGIHDAPVAFV